MSGRAARRALALLALTLLAAPGCRRSPADPETVIVVRAGDLECTLGDLQRYLAANLPEQAAERDLSAEDLRRVRSRLLDAFVDERLLLGEALRRQLSVDDVEVEAWIGFARGDEEVPVTRSRWEETRRQLLIQKLEEDVWRKLPPIGDVEVAERVAAGPPAEQRRVLLRSLRLASVEDARRVAEELRRKRLTFDEALVLHGTSTDGVPVELGWETLRPEHRQALEGLKRGQISDPLEMAGAVYLFRVERWLEGTDEAQRTAEARQTLERERRQRAFDRLLTSLRGTVEVRIETASLPFAYVADDGES